MILCEHAPESGPASPELDVRECVNCGARYCGDCRQGTDRCPVCNSLLVSNAACSVTGGCGDGSQES